MAFDYTPTTELEAVNAMLGVTGDSPVNTLNVTGAVDVDTARQILYETSRKIQAGDWHFNSEVNYPLSPSTDGYLIPPPNTLKIKVAPSYMASFDLAQRGTKMYDRVNHTYVFTQTVKFNLVLFLPFTDLPQAARDYITIAAGRIYQKKMLASETLDGFSKEDELMAKAQLDDADALNADLNMMNNYDVFRTIDRNSDFATPFNTSPS